jgi:hypothetical protein
MTGQCNDGKSRSAGVFWLDEMLMPEFCRSTCGPLSSLTGGHANGLLHLIRPVFSIHQGIWLPNFNMRASPRIQITSPTLSQVGSTPAIYARAPSPRSSGLPGMTSGSTRSEGFHMNVCVRDRVQWDQGQAGLCTDRVRISNLFCHLKPNPPPSSTIDPTLAPPLSLAMCCAVYVALHDACAANAVAFSSFGAQHLRA